MIAAWAAVKLFLSGIPRQVWYALALILAIWGAYSWAYGRGAESVQHAWDAERAAMALDAAAQEAESAATEAKQAAAFAALADNLRKENEHAKQNADRTIAKLRAGTLRVRETLRCPRAVPGAAAGPARSDDDGGAYVSRQNQEFFLRIGAEADGVARQLNTCIQILQAERQP